MRVLMSFGSFTWRRVVFARRNGTWCEHLAANFDEAIFRRLKLQFVAKGETFCPGDLPLYAIHVMLCYHSGVGNTGGVTMQVCSISTAALRRNFRAEVHKRLSGSNSVVRRVPLSLTKRIYGERGSLFRSHCSRRNPLTTQ